MSQFREYLEMNEVTKSLVDKRYGDWSVTQHKLLKYNDDGSKSDGIVKLVNQKTMDDIIISNDLSSKSNEYFTQSIKGVSIKDKNLNKIILKAIKAFEKNL